MGYGCCGIEVKNVRIFLTQEEKIELPKEYKADLEKESQGVIERIKQLEISS